MSVIAHPFDEYDWEWAGEASTSGGVTFGATQVEDDEETESDE